MGILQEVSDLIDLPIREGRWLTYMNMLNAEGKPDRITMVKIVFTICKDLELMEAYNARLTSRVEELETKLSLLTYKKPESPLETGYKLEEDLVVDVNNPNHEFKCDFPGCTFGTNVKISLSGHKRKHKINEPVA